MSNKTLIISDIYSYKEMCYISKIIKENITNEITYLIISDKDEKKFDFNLPDGYLIKIDNPFNPYLKKEVINIINQIEPEIIVSTSSYEIKNLIATISVDLKCGLLTDCNMVYMEDGKLYAEKFAYGGNIIAKLVSNSNIKIITMNPVYEPDIFNQKYSLKEITLEKNNAVELLKKENPMDTIPLEFAKKVVGIGRGVREEDIPLVENFAKKINAAIGYTRPLIHQGIASQDHQIGITGKIISPKLYIAIGISGKVHHIRGIEQSEIIISVNIDPDAPIKKISDYFIICDYKQFIEKILKN